MHFLHVFEAGVLSKNDDKNENTADDDLKRRQGATSIGGRDSMLYMIVEHFRGDPVPVYRRFREHGRLAPEGLRYICSWVSQDLQHCFQIMECHDPHLLQEWINRWKDLVDFEITPVVTSEEAAAMMTPRL